MDLCVVSFITSSHFDVDIKQDPKPVVKYYSFRVDFVMGWVELLQVGLEIEE